MNLNFYWSKKREEKEITKQKRLSVLKSFDKLDFISYEKLMLLFDDENCCIPDVFGYKKDFCHLNSSFGCALCWVKFLSSKVGLNTLKAFCEKRDLKKGTYMSSF